MKVDIDELNELVEKIRKINRANIDDIEFYQNDKKIEIPDDIMDDWRFTGLCNTDLITTGFYLNGFEDIE